MPKPHNCKCEVEGCESPATRKMMCSKHFTRARRYGDPLFLKTAGHGEVPLWLEAHKNYAGDECLTWPFSYNGKGYGQTKHDGRMRGAHRVMCELAHGAPPIGKYDAAHSCGKGHFGCVNPRHLSWKTRKANLGDMATHGTKPLGEKSSCAKITEAQAIEIITMAKDKSHSEIAQLFGIARRTVSAIINGENWPHLHEVRSEISPRWRSGSRCSPSSLIETEKEIEHG